MGKHNMGREYPLVALEGTTAADRHNKAVLQKVMSSSSSVQFSYNSVSTDRFEY